MSENVNICAVCKIPATQLCGVCKNVFYCNRDHQKKHWKEGHKNNCSLFKIVVSDKVGHHIVATRDIKQNEVILKENPILTFPANSESCLSCNRRQKNVEENKCSVCNWPVCEKKCQDSAAHVKECKLMKERGFKVSTDGINGDQLHKVLAVIRYFLFKSTVKSKYDAIFSLPSREPSTAHLEKIKTTLLPILKNELKLELTENEIISIATKFDLHSFEIIKDDGEINLHGLYAIAALLSHNCQPNTKYSFHGESQQMVLIATVPIAKGETIATTYAETLWGTLARRGHLLESKNIVCECKRCVDSTELGTYLGAIFCSRCKKPNETACPKMLSTDALNPIAIWKCEKCDHTIRGRQMAWGNDAIRSEINRIDKRNPLNLEKFLVKYKETLHPKNYHVLVVKYALLQMYGNRAGYTLSDLTDEIIERKIDICHELLEVVDELDPGYSKIRGSILYDLQATMVVQTKKEFNKGNITKAAAQDTLMECLVILKEATQILSSEPDTKEFLKEQLENFSKELNFDE